MENKGKYTVCPDERLRTAMEFVRPGSYVADVGTDHAILPIRLCLDGRIRGAIASDINEGPIRNAADNISAAGLSGKIATLRTDGLHGIGEYRPDDIIIFGMGGELIARILSEAEFIKDPAIRLILQPMTHAQNVREYLSRNGFAIVGERLSRADGRIYQTVCAEYTGNTYTLTLPELYFGRMSGELYPEFVRHNLKVWQTRRDGRAEGGLDTSEEDTIINFLQREDEKNENNRIL